MLGQFSEDVQGSTLIPSTSPHLDSELELAQDLAMHQWAAELSASFDQPIREAMREGRVARAAQLGLYYLNAHGLFEVENRRESAFGCRSDNPSCRASLLRSGELPEDATTEELAVVAVARSRPLVPLVQLVGPNGLSSQDFYKGAYNSGDNGSSDYPAAGWTFGRYSNTLWTTMLGTSGKMEARALETAHLSGTPVIQAFLSPSTVETTNNDSQYAVLQDNPAHAEWLRRAGPAGKALADTETRIRLNQSCKPGYWTLDVVSQKTMDAVDYGDGTLHRAPTGQAATHEATITEMQERWVPARCTPKDAELHATLTAELARHQAAVAAIGPEPERKIVGTRTYELRSSKGQAQLVLVLDGEEHAVTISYAASVTSSKKDSVAAAQRDLMREIMRATWELVIRPYGEQGPPYLDQLGPEVDEAEREAEIAAWHELFRVDFESGSPHYVDLNLRDLTSGYLERQIKTHRDITWKCQELEAPQEATKYRTTKGIYVHWDNRRVNFDSRKEYQRKLWEPCLNYLERMGEDPPDAAE